MIKTKKIVIYYKKQNISLVIQYDIDIEFYPEKKNDKELQGVMVMQIWGDKKYLNPIMHEDKFIQKVRDKLIKITNKKIINIPDDAWPEKESDWPIIKNNKIVLPFHYEEE